MRECGVLDAVRGQREPGAQVIFWAMSESADPRDELLLALSPGERFLKALVCPRSCVGWRGKGRALWPKPMGLRPWWIDSYANCTAMKSPSSSGRVGAPRIVSERHGGSVGRY